MSIRLMSDAWLLPIPTAQKMVLLVLCDYANDEGMNVYPSVAMVAKKASMSERNAQRIMRMLEEDGFIALVANEGGGAGKTRHYVINVELVKKGDSLSPMPEKRVTNEAEKGDILSPLSEKRVTNETKKGDTGVTRSIIDPLLKKETISNDIVSKERATRLSHDTLPDDWHAWQRTHCPVLDGRDVFNRFHDYWVAQAGQKGVKADWFATWRNWCRKEADNIQNRTKKGYGYGNQGHKSERERGYERAFANVAAAIERGEI